MAPEPDPNPQVQPSVAVVILNWNGRKWLERFLPALIERSDFPNTRLIVADNASEDDSVEYVEREFKEIELLLLDRNYGFAEGYNRAIAQLKDDYVVLLNSDVEVGYHWIGPVIDTMESDPRIAVAQPKIKSYYEQRLFEYGGAAGGYIDWLGYPFCKGRIFDEIERDNGQYDAPADIFWAGGSALFIRRERYLEAGGLDPDFFAHMEEIDLCWRLANMGHRLVYVPGSEIFHVGGGTLSYQSARKTYLNFRNNLEMMLKNLPLGKAFFVIFIRLFLDGLAAAQLLVSQKSPEYPWAVARAHWNFFFRIPRILSKRKAIAREADIPTIYGKSIVWQYFAKGKKRFSDLNFG